MTTTTVDDPTDGLDLLTNDELRDILVKLVGSAPTRARKADLITWIRTARAMEAETPALDAAPEQPADEATAPEKPEPEKPEPEKPGTTVEPLGERSVIPTIAKWEQLVAMGEFLSRSNLTPKALRGKPEDVTTVLLGANDLGIPMTQALNKLIVIDGKLSMAAELMVALVLRDGHSLVPEPGNDQWQATARYRRRDTGDEGTVSFTIDDAIAAGLVAVRDGKPWARSNDGKPTPWEKYTPDMLWARCVSRTCRRVFPDCLAGVSYTPEELGYIEVEEGGGPAIRGRAGETEPTMTLHQQQVEIARRVQELPDDLRHELAAEWKRRNLPRTADLRPGAIRTVLHLLEPIEQRAADREAAETADIPEAETVPTDDAPESAAADGPQEPVESGDDDGDGLDNLVCVACEKPITEADVLVWDDSERPWHADCAPI